MTTKRSRAWNAVQSLDAVVLIAKHLEVQRRFYADILGLPVVGDYGDAVFFDCGAQKLALFAHSHHPEGTERLEGASKGISHLEFGISREDYEAMKERLRSQGFHAYGENFCDADGNLFHFNVR